MAVELENQSNVDAGKPLLEAFADARALVDRFVESVPSSQPAFHEAALALEECEAQVARLALFSPNEEADDIATGYLRYLLLPHLLAEVLSRPVDLDASSRRPWLEQALQEHSRFLQSCDLYGLLPAAATRPWQAFRDAGSPCLTDPTAARADKIMRLKASRAARSQLEELQARQGDHANAEVDREAVDEDVQREAWLLQLELAALTSTDQLSSLQQEIRILQMAPDRHSCARESQRQANNGPRAAEPAGSRDAGAAESIMAQLRLAASDLEGGRQRIAGSVLGPSHRLPTRTLAQQADIEMDRARQAQVLQQQQARDATSALSDEEDEEQVMRQRARDDYRDTHPTGWGNSKLRPCA